VKSLASGATTSPYPVRVHCVERVNIDRIILKGYKADLEALLIFPRRLLGLAKVDESILGHFRGFADFRKADGAQK